MKSIGKTIYLLLKASTFSLLIYTSSGNASPLLENIPTSPNKLDLSLEQIANESQEFINFEKMKPLNLIDYIKSNYLTLYSNKFEKVNADYVNGSYGIYYTQIW